MLAEILLSMVLGGYMHAAVQLEMQPPMLSSDNQPKSILVAQYYKAGPDHGPDPHNEIHDYGLPAHPNWSNDPYGGTQGNISDPYCGSQGFIQDPYAGTAPYAPY